MAKKYDDFDEPEGNGAFDQILSIVGEHKRTFAIASVSAAVLLLGLIVWGSYPDGDASSESVPIVRADAGSYKTTPDDPGGMEIPYRDSTVFSSGEQADAGTENILADSNAEQPVPRSQLFAGLNTEGQQAAQTTTAQINGIEGAATPPPPSNDALVKEAIGTAPDASATTSPATAEQQPGLNPILPQAPQTTTTTQAPAVPAPVDPVDRTMDEKMASATVTPTAVKPVEKAPAEKTAEKAAKTEPAAGASTAAKAVTPGGFYVQVGSVRSESGAAGEWKKIQAKYASLGGLKYRTQEASLAKGTFYRIQAGPMSKDSANDICNKMKAKTPGACLVTK